MDRTIQFTLYGVKSERRNAKCNYRGWTAWPDGEDGFKKTITPDNLADMEDWLKRNEYRLFKLCVYSGTVCLHNWAACTFYSWEPVMHKARLFAEILNAHSKYINEMAQYGGHDGPLF